MIGETLGHYRILDRLGGGGMGEVYRAEDTQLGREVALKVLRPELVDSPERRQRFEREARALAALNHPHIVTVYSVEQAGGRDFITMELVRGERLSRRIWKGGLPVSDLLELAIPLADALAAAHDQGITHRDLKPDNVMVGPEGGVKVLDFGLAKLRPQGPGLVDSQLATATMTTEGQIVGTVAYMSPEQAQGRPVDHRSDIFSLGVVLYEMATGERPFRGETASALLAAIHKDTPTSVTELRPELPRELGRILRRALAKDPDERIQTAKELRSELRELKAEVDSGEAWDRPRPVRARRRWALVAGLAVVAAAAGAAIWLQASREPVRQPVTVTPITSDPAEEASIRLSPDGKLLAFTRVNRDAAGRDRGADLCVKQIAGGEPLRVAESVVGGGELAWSPDGQEVAFFRAVPRQDGGSALMIVVVPALGGNERRLATAYETSEEGGAGSSSLDWSLDGTLLAIADIEGPGDWPAIYLVSRETGEKRRLTRPPPEARPYGDSSPRFSPDGHTVAFVRGGMPQSDIFLVPTRGGEPRPLTSGNWVTSGLDWAADGETLLFSSTRSPRGGVFGLWKVPIGGGDPQPLAVGERGHGPTLSRSGSRLAYVRTDDDRDIWRVGGPTATEGERRRPHRFISSTWWDWAPEYSFDGQSVLFTSHRSGFGEVWVADADGTHPRQLTSLRDTLTTTNHGGSPDGRQLAVMSGKEGNWDVYLLGTGGGIPRRLTGSPTNEYGPSWSRDGRWIYYTTDRSGRPEVWRMHPDGSEAAPVTRRGGSAPVEWSGDLYYTKSGLGWGRPGLWRLPVGGGDETQILDSVYWFNWDVFERGICYLDFEAQPKPRIGFYEFATSRVRPVLEFEERPSVFGMSVSPDGRWILYVKSESWSDIMLVEGFR